MSETCLDLNVSLDLLGCPKHRCQRSTYQAITAPTVSTYTQGVEDSVVVLQVLGIPL